MSEPNSVVLIGDVYVECNNTGVISGIAQEAPVPIIKIKDRTFVMGGTANIAVNIAHLSHTAELICTTSGDGEDSGTQLLYEVLSEHEGVNCHTYSHKDHTVTIKTTICDEYGVPIFRMDDDPIVPFSSYADPVDKATLKTLNTLFEDKKEEIGAVAVCDFGYGAINAKLLTTISSITANENTPFIVVKATKSPMPAINATAVLLPLDIAESLAKVADSEESLLNRAKSAAVVLMGQKEFENVHSCVVFTGGLGAAAVTRSDKSEGMLIDIAPNCNNTELFDSSGTLETAAAVFLYEVMLGSEIYDCLQSAELGEHIASTKRGVSIIHHSELIEAQDREGFTFLSKFSDDLDSASFIIELADISGREVAIVVDTFDGIELVTMELFRRAKLGGRVVIAGIIDDNSCEYTLEERIDLVNGLTNVDLSIPLPTSWPPVVAELCPTGVVALKSTLDESDIDDLMETVGFVNLFDPDATDDE